MSTYLPNDDMASFSRVLSKSKHIIAVAGAGLSAASGIPTFRGAGGFWRKYDAISLATPEAFRNNPSRVWQFYHYRREKALQCEPNPAHMALAAFSNKQIREVLAPRSTFTLITQNVDGLSRRALDSIPSSVPGIDIDAGAIDSQPVLLEMHGRLFDVVCTSSACGHRELNFTSPIVPALAGTEKFVEAADIEPEIPTTDLPRCSKCGALARPGVVWFGEVPHYLDVISKLVDKADLCIVVGTSSTVYPAAGYASEVQDHGGKVAVFNLDRSEGDEDADFLFLGPCEKTLPAALGLKKD
ncbi:DHS-like NAD/FAD-binding domain-containing protein [Gloeophyllum trabeum ATCC 11539]|uniref:NAD-dependent protein deacylase n=1 Tax=Gloeophyllum trabeum (strain ATCC 11539 / FP-39264 / Madison 617) TaxID=670483 RepID=S7QIT3_GLOTA|nr:DHS-like NAD/FAD-binding domain-containing protein [Gloeophyllum trabeum ATCC 11539]EPQ59536.1 DHS-like NAD/FAD-binding domain-containing protein [Gloeophyllum trabeum ATCC 11539]